MYCCPGTTARFPDMRAPQSVLVELVELIFRLVGELYPWLLS